MFPFTWRKRKKACVQANKASLKCSVVICSVVIFFLELIQFSQVEWVAFYLTLSVIYLLKGTQSRNPYTNLSGKSAMNLIK